MAYLAFIAALGLSTAHPLPMANATQSAGAPKVEDLGGGLYALFNRGGNMMFSVGEDGTFVVDNQFATTAAANIAAIKGVSDGPISFVLNTHHHGDHTGGNNAFADAGALVLAHDNVRRRLGASVEAGELDANALPVITFSDTTTFHWNGDEIFVFHMPTAHTDGDALVHVVNENIIHTGDTMFSGRFPFIDLASGGTVDGAIAALQAAYDLADENTKIVPGHGPISTRDDIKASIDMIKETRALVKALLDAGKSRDDVISANPLTDYEAFGWRFITTERFTGTLYDDLAATAE